MPGCHAGGARFYTGCMHSPAPSDPSASEVPAGPLPVLGRAHARRLRDTYRSAGWPSQDAIEIELLAAGLLERQYTPEGRDKVRLTDLGIRWLAQALQKNRQALSAHDALVGQVADSLLRAGRLVWTGLSLRARLPGPPDEAPRWKICMPDVFSMPQHHGGGLPAAGGARDQGQPGRSAGRPEVTRQARQLPRCRGPVLVCAGLRRARAGRSPSPRRCRCRAASCSPRPKAARGAPPCAPARDAGPAVCAVDGAGPATPLPALASGPWDDPDQALLVEQGPP
jgi:hypothetical protein